MEKQATMAVLCDDGRNDSLDLAKHVDFVEWRGK